MACSPFSPLEMPSWSSLEHLKNVYKFTAKHSLPLGERIPENELNATEGDCKHSLKLLESDGMYSNH